jgi:hypothetical protein
VNRRQHGQRVAALRVLSDRVAAAQKTGRAEAERAFLAARLDDGTKSLDVTLDDGTPLGSIAIKKGATTVKVDDAALFDLVERAHPGEIAEEVSAAALADPEVLAWIRKHRPGLIGRTVRPAFKAKLLKDLDGQGCVVDTATGEFVKVAEITHEPPTGAFAYTPSKNAADAVMQAWQRGELAGVLGDVLRPAIEGGES